jgi:hypothetical protein
MSTTKFVQGVRGHVMVGQNPGTHMPPPPHLFLFFYSTPTHLTHLLRAPQAISLPTHVAVQHTSLITNQPGGG